MPEILSRIIRYLDFFAFLIRKSGSLNNRFLMKGNGLSRHDGFCRCRGSGLVTFDRYSGQWNTGRKPPVRNQSPVSGKERRQTGACQDCPRSLSGLKEKMNRVTGAREPFFRSESMRLVPPDRGRRSGRNGEFSGSGNGYPVLRQRS